MHGLKRAKLERRADFTIYSDSGLPHFSELFLFLDVQILLSNRWENVIDIFDRVDLETLVSHEEEKE